MSAYCVTKNNILRRFLIYFIQGAEAVDHDDNGSDDGGDEHGGNEDNDDDNDNDDGDEDGPKDDPKDLTWTPKKNYIYEGEVRKSPRRPQPRKLF